MRLFEAIIDANHRALAGDKKAGLHVADYADELPVIALTCIDPRLNKMFPGVLGLPDDQFIWSRNAGNVILGTTSSMMRSLALACAIKGGREIVIIGHSDCRVRHTTLENLTLKLKEQGVDFSQLPGSLMDYFDIFASERDNVIRSTSLVRQSPLIGPKVPVHGMMVDIETGMLDWVVNGYETLGRPSIPLTPGLQMPELGGVLGQLSTTGGFNIGEMKFPETKIGEIVTDIKKFIEPEPPAPAAPPVPPTVPPPRSIPVPPPIPKPGLRMKKS